MIAPPRVRQLGLGELLDETFRLYRAGFATFLAIAALVYVPYALLSLVLSLPLSRELQQFQATLTASNPAIGPGDIFQLFSGLLLSSLGVIAASLLYSIIFQPLLQGALTRAVAQRYAGAQFTVGDAFGTALRRAWPLIGSRLLTALLGGSLFFVGIAVYFVAILAVLNASFQNDGFEPRPIGALIGTGALIVSFILAGGILLLYVSTRLLYTPQAAVVEQHGPWGSVRRSWRLTQGYFWRTLGFLIVIALLVWLVSIIPSSLFSLPVALLFPDNFTLQRLADTIVSSVVAVIVTPFAAIAYTLMYFDLRVRKEAFDLEQRADRVLPPAPAGLPGAS